MVKLPHARCGSCPLKDTPLVPGEGPVKAEFVLVGEAPGREEASARRPFVGQAGKLLDKILVGLGIDREELYITNAIACGGTTTTYKEAAPYCRDRLLAEIDGRKPRVVVTLGNLPTSVLLGPSYATGVTNYRGKFVMHDALNCWVLPTLHPAAVLRRPSTFDDLCADLQKAFTTTEYEPKPFKWYVCQTGQNALVVLDHIYDKETEVVFDLETSGFNRQEDDILCLVLCWRSDLSYVIPQGVLEQPAVQARLCTLMVERPDIKWIGHSAKFDAEFLKSRYGFRPVIYFDTLLAHYCTEERSGTHDLKSIAANLFNAPDWEGDLKQHLKKPRTDSYSMLPKGVLYKYAAHDGIYTYLLYRHFQGVLAKEPKLKKLHDDLLVPAANALVDIELYGVRVDPAHLKQLEKDYARDIEDLGAQLEVAVGRPINANSPKQVAEYLYDELQLPQPFGRTTKKEAMEILAPMHPVPQMIVDIRHAKKMLKTYVIGLQELADKHDRVHTSFLLHGTTTGRLSSRGPNLQNIPRGQKLRDCFIASEGHTLIDCDYGQLEYRILAVLGNDEYMLKCFREGRDFHTETALLFFGENHTSEDRMIAKMVNFGIAYGRGAASMAADRNLNMTFREAQAFLRSLFDQRPGVARYTRETPKKAFTTGVLESFFGRKRRFGLVSGVNMKEVKTQALNFPIQSLASDITLMSLLYLHDTLEHARILLTVHDSILLEAPDEHVYTEASRIKKVMELIPRKRFSDVVDFPVDIKVGKSWGNMSEWAP